MKLSECSLFKTEYKIVPTYSKENKRNGYVPLSKNIIGWWPLKMFQYNEDGTISETEAFFKTYEEAMSFIKHEISILSDEEILGTKDI